MVIDYSIMKLSSYCGSDQISDVMKRQNRLDFDVGRNKMWVKKQQ